MPATDTIRRIEEFKDWILVGCNGPVNAATQAHLESLDRDIRRLGGVPVQRKYTLVK